jgi:Nucleotidyl transferase AbiEii toxin, Type IV TA system
MVHAEKIVTTIVRGTTSTRWRDFADLYLLARQHPIYRADLAASIQHVADHRGTRLAPLAQALDGYGAIGQQR